MVVTLKGYGDESADETKARVFAVAMVLGSEDEWGDAIMEWLRRTRGLPFHATDCETEYADHPDPQKHKDNLALYADLTQILAKSYLVGFAFAVDLQSHRQVFPDVPSNDWAYYKCFSDLIAATARTALGFNANVEEPDDVFLEFTFDSRLESNGTAGVLYTMLANNPDWRDSGIMNTKVSFEGGSSEARLEMGDLLARESMKELDRKVSNSPRGKRRSRLALEETQKFHFIEHGHDYWLRLRAMIETPESAKVREEYIQWLVRTGKVQHGVPVHNMVNWILYNAWLDNRDVTEKKRGDGSFLGS